VWQAGAEGSQRSRGGPKSASSMDRMSCPQDTPSGGDDSELGPDAHVGCRWRGIFETNPMRGVRQGSSRLARGGPRNRATRTTIAFGWLLGQRQVPTVSWNRDGPPWRTDTGRGSGLAQHRSRTKRRESRSSERNPRADLGPRCDAGVGDFTSDRASTSCPLRWARGSEPATTSVTGSLGRTCLPGRGKGQEGQPPGPIPRTRRLDVPRRPANPRKR
jgi:hypothetical protein